jgi:Tfp pilus assembly protein PilV
MKEITEEVKRYAGSLYAGNGRVSSKKQDEYAQSLLLGIVTVWKNAAEGSREEKIIDQIWAMNIPLRWGVYDEGTVRNIIETAKKCKKNPEKFFLYLTGADLE